MLDPNGELLLKWTVDYATQKIQFRIKISDKAPVFNWFALGFSDRGTPENSDYCVFWRDYNGFNHFQVNKNKKVK